MNLFKDFIQFILRYAGAAVGNLRFYHAFIFRNFDPYVSVFGGEFNRIINQIIKHLLNFPHISIYRNRARKKQQLDRNMLWSTYAFERGGRAFYDILDVETGLIQQKFFCPVCPVSRTFQIRERPLH